MRTANSSVTSTDVTGRVSFSKIAPAMELPNLITIQKESFERFMGEGLANAFAESSPIENNAGTMEITFGDHEFGDPAHTVAECRAKDVTYQAPLLVEVRFTNKETGEIKEQLVFMGDFPLMTDRGTFIINGTERIVVSQLVRSPGVYFSKELDSNVEVFKVQFIPARGAWLEFEVDKRGKLVVSIDRKRRQNATVMLRALGIAESDDEIVELLGDSDIVRDTLASDTARTRDEALIEIYKRQRPGEPPTVDAARSLVDGLYLNPQRYDLARVGRYKIDKKLGIDVPADETILTAEDIVAALRYLLALRDGDTTKKVDDIDHFGNRRVRTVGELVQNQFRIGMSRMERVVRERMASQDPTSRRSRSSTSGPSWRPSRSSSAPRSCRSSWTRPTRCPASPTSAACRPSAPAASPATSRAPAAAPTCPPPCATSTTPTTRACAPSRPPRAPTSASSAPSPSTPTSTTTASSRPRTAASWTAAPPTSSTG